MSNRRAAVAVVAAALFAATAGACRGHSAAGHGGTSTTVASSDGSGGSGGTTTSSSTTTAPSGRRTTTTAGHTTTTTVPGTATTTQPGTAPVGPPTPAAAGTYAYRQSGSSSSGGSSTPAPAKGTLVVDQPSNGSQTFHRYADPSQPPEDTTYLDRSDGRFVTRIVIRASVGGQHLTFTCNFNPPMPAPSWPPNPGASFSGHGDCGAVQADVTGQVTAVQQATVDGQTRTVRVVKTDTKVSGQAQGDITETDWFDPALGLDVHSERHTSLKYGFSSYQSDLTSDLESTRPS